MLSLLCSAVQTTLLWSSIYYLLRHVLPDRSAEFSNRIVTLVHGLVMAFFGIGECFRNGWAFSEYNVPTTDAQTILLMLSLGYFVFDLVWCVHFQTETKLMIFHHVYSCFTICRQILKNKNGQQACCALGGMELTNPCLQLRWFIRTYGFHKTWYFYAVEISFIAAFVFIRLVIGSFLTIQIVCDKNNDFEFKALVTLMYIVSWVFALNMMDYIRKKYFKGRDLTEDAVVI